MPQPQGGSPGQRNLSYAQLEGVWIDAAQPKLGRAKAYALAPLMAAIAEAESGGNPNAYNPTDNGGTQSSYGLWQISNGTHSAPAANWADPSENASLAVAKYQTPESLSNWGTYDSGAYKAYMSAKTSPDFNIPGNPGGRFTEAGADAAQQAGGTHGSCLIGFGSHVTIPVIPGVFHQTVSAPTICLLSKAQTSRLLGGGLIILGGLILLVPVQLLATEKVVQVVMPIARNRITSSIRSYAQPSKSKSGSKERSTAKADVETAA